MKPKIFIASPLFNPNQIAIIERIENLLTEKGYDFYSARLHSGSDKMTPEQRKDITAWDPVFDSNERGLDECDVMIAVLEYAMPPREYPAHIQMAIIDNPDLEPCGPGTVFTPIELPDAGTVWECGYHRAQGKLVLGFHTDQAKHLNLMLSHGCDGLIKGWENLDGFLTEPKYMPVIPERLVKRLKIIGRKNSEITDSYFNWKFTESWDAANKEVE